MSDVDRLRLMDPYEVHSKTYITPKILRQLLDGEYEKFDSKTNAIGLVKVLERELGLDLTELKREIERFFNDPINQELIQRRQRERMRRITDIERGQTHQASSPFATILKILVTIIILFIVADIYIVYFAHKQNLPAFALFSAKDAQKSVVDSSHDASALPLQKDSTKTEQKESLQQSSDTTNTDKSLQIATSKPQTQAEQAQSDAASHQPLKAAGIQEENSSTQTAATTPYTIILQPTKKVWIGVIYLDNGQKRMLTTQEPFEINLSRDQLIVTGHGFFDLLMDGKKQHFSSATTQRLLIKDGQLQFVDKETFKKYNKGRNW